MNKIIVIIAALACTVTAAFAQGPTQPIPPNTIDCKQFRKVGQAWTEIGTAVFDVGNVKQTSLSDSSIMPHFMNVGGVDLYYILETKCGS